MKLIHIILLVTLCISITQIGYTQSRKPEKIQKIITKSARQKLPGIAMYIYEPEHGEWIGMAGYSNVEKKIPLQKENIFALGSIGKMYNAVAALLLVEEGKLKLDEKISNYLSEEIITNLPNGESITIRHLLGNTSGLYNYEADPTLNELYISGKLSLDTLSHLNALRRYVYGKPATNKPGEAYHYSSTNFMLLAMIMDQVTPTGHSEYLRNNLLIKYGFNNTYYRQTPSSNLVGHYGDLNQDGILENLTTQTIETTNWFMGDDGIYARSHLKNSKTSIEV